MKVLVMATDSLSTWMVVNALKDKYDLTVALEGPVSRLKLMKGRLQKQGFLTVFGQTLFMIYSVLMRKRSSVYINRLISESGLLSDRPEFLRPHFFKSFNDEDFIGWLVSVRPDVVVVNGTRILSSKVLSAIDTVFINTHCGITPAYRGVHGAYWALANKDNINAGVTVHFVDSGIDTGLIINQSKITIGADDNFTTYPVKQYIAAIPLLLKALDDFDRGDLKGYRRDDLKSSIWYHPTLWFYFFCLFKAGVR